MERRAFIHSLGRRARAALISTLGLIVMLTLFAAARLADA